MAAPSIGDVLTLLEIVYKVGKKCHDAPNEVENATRDLKQMKTELESMQEKVNNKNSFIYKNQGEMLARVYETFEPLVNDLDRMKSLLIEFRNIPPYSGQKAIFAIFKVPAIKDIQGSFVDYRGIWSSAFQHIGAEADADMAARNARLEQKIAAMERRQIDGVKSQKETKALMEQLLKDLKKSNSPAAPNSATSTGIVPQAQEQLEAHMRAAGLKADDIKRVMGLLKLDAAAPPINVTSSPGAADSKGKNDGQNKSKNGGNHPSGKLEVPSRPRASSETRAPKVGSSSPDPSVKKATRTKSPVPIKNPPPKSPSPTPQPQPPKSSSPKLPPSITPPPRKPVKTEHLWILCVDRTNGFRSIQAKTYLSLLRLWTANTSSPPGHNWLFNHITTAGLNLATPLTAGHNIPAYTPPTKPEKDKAITAMAGTPSYFWSQDEPFEKSTIIDRAQQQSKGTAKGLEQRHFTHYDYILCFTDDVREGLLRVQKELREEGKAVKGKVVLVNGTQWFITAKHTHPAEVDEVTTDLRNGIKKFLAEELRWQRPTGNRGMAGGEGRTVQIVLPWRRRGVLVEKLKDKDVREAELLKDCKLWIEGKTTDAEQLVCVTGPKWKLKEVETWVKGLV